MSIAPAPSVETATTNDESIGLVQGEFPCAWKNYNGTLVAGSQGVVFTGSFFLFETTLSMQWDSILKVQNYEETNGSLEILLKDGNAHVFRCLSEKSWLLLMTLHNDALLLDRTTTSETPRLQRRKSDPAAGFFGSAQQQALTVPMEPSTSYVASLVDDLPLGIIEKGAGIPIHLHDGKCSHKNMMGRLFSGPHAICFTARRGAIFWEHIVLSIPWLSIHQIHQEDDGVQITTTNSMEYNFQVTEPNSLWATLLALQNEELTKTPGSQHRRRNSDPLSQQLNLVYEDAVEIQPGGPGSVPNSPMRSNKATVTASIPNWDTLKSQKLDTTVIEDLRLSPCTMDKFFDTFLADNAPDSLSSFLEGRGDTELNATPWKDDERVVLYMHPINAPLAPPEARARKEQSFERYGAKGLIVKTRTVVDDVPTTDCFYVADRILVERVDADTISVRMEFQITFVKSTMFQGLIRKTTSSEFTDFFRALATYCENAIDPQNQKTAAKPSVIVKERLVKEPGGGWLSPHCIMFGVVLLVQFYILHELRDIKSSIRSMKTRQ